MVIFIENDLTHLLTGDKVPCKLIAVKHLGVLWHMIIVMMKESRVR